MKMLVRRIKSGLSEHSFFPTLKVLRVQPSSGHPIGNIQLQLKKFDKYHQNHHIKYNICKFFTYFVSDFQISPCQDAPCCFASQ
jgi:hypothetical protein